MHGSLSRFNVSGILYGVTLKFEIRLPHLCIVRWEETYQAIFWPLMRGMMKLESHTQCDE